MFDSDDDDRPNFGGARRASPASRSKEEPARPAPSRSPSFVDDSDDDVSLLGRRPERAAPPQSAKPDVTKQIIDDSDRPQFGSKPVSPALAEPKPIVQPVSRPNERPVTHQIHAAEPAPQPSARATVKPVEPSAPPVSTTATAPPTPPVTAAYEQSKPVPLRPAPVSVPPLVQEPERTSGSTGSSQLRVEDTTSEQPNRSAAPKQKNKPRSGSTSVALIAGAAVGGVLIIGAGVWAGFHFLGGRGAATSSSSTPTAQPAPMSAVAVPTAPPVIASVAVAPRADATPAPASAPVGASAPAQPAVLTASARAPVAPPATPALAGPAPASAAEASPSLAAVPAPATKPHPHATHHSHAGEAAAVQDQNAAAMKKLDSATSVFN